MGAWSSILPYGVEMHLFFTDEFASFHRTSALENFNQKALRDIRVYVSHIPRWHNIVEHIRFQNIIQ
jgi:hypothetical protein